MRPDVVILDFQVPGMNGIEVGQEIRKTDPNAFLILFSLHASKQLEDLAKIVGITEAMTSKKASVAAGKVTDVQSSSVPAIPAE